jgi:hypothetical protein
MGVVLLIAGVGLVAVGGRAGGTLKDFGVCVTETNCDVSDSFLSEFDCVDSGDCSYYSGFAVSDMSNSANV